MPSATASGLFPRPGESDDCFLHYGIRSTVLPIRSTLFNHEDANAIDIVPKEYVQLNRKNALRESARKATCASD